MRIVIIIVKQSVKVQQAAAQIAFVEQFKQKLGNKQRLLRRGVYPERKRRAPRNDKGQKQGNDR